MSRTETIVLESDAIHHMDGVFHQWIVARSPSSDKRLDDAIHQSIGKEDAESCRQDNQTDLRHRLVVAHYYIKQGQIQGNPRQSRCQDDHHLVHQHIATSIEEVEDAQVYL